VLIMIQTDQAGTMPSQATRRRNNPTAFDIKADLSGTGAWGLQLLLGRDGAQLRVPVGRSNPGRR
jgi:hypothetical protein